jgi:hypothetical protein
MDRRWHGQKGAGAWWFARWSMASSQSGAQELAGEGAKERGKHREPISGRTGARGMVWWPADGDDAAGQMDLGGGSA